jgi:hypothetical protein
MALIRTLLASWVFLAGSSGPSDLEHLRLVCAVARDTIKFGDPVLIDLQVHNGGDRWVRASLPLDSASVDLWISVEGGGRSWGWDSNGPDRADFANPAYETRIPAGGYVGRTYALGTRGSAKRLDPGTYRVYCAITVGTPSDASGPARRLRSDPVSVTVMP